MPEFIGTDEGRRLFGLNPEGYASVRPEYPDAIYELLHAHRALVPNTVTLEIGAGSGLATRRLIERGANPITVIEPDFRFAPLLRGLAKTSDAELRLIQSPFEDADLARASFDLVVAATSFHWLDPDVAIDKIADVLRPGGYAALWWNVFGDLDREDAFHEATRSILADLAISPSGAPDAIPFALDRGAREVEFNRGGKFEGVVYAQMCWTLVLDVPQVGRLYESFSHIQRLPQAQRLVLLQQLMDVARTQFGGRVERNMTSPIYLARRKS